MTADQATRRFYLTLSSAVGDRDAIICARMARRAGVGDTVIVDALLAWENLREAEVQYIQSVQR